MNDLKDFTQISRNLKLYRVFHKEKLKFVLQFGN